MKILSFGNIPTWAGGRNDNGLSNVIYQLAYNISHIDGVDMTLVATDVNVPLFYRDSLKIVGWTKPVLLTYALQHPFIILLFLYYVIKFKFKYKHYDSFWGLILKMLLLNKSVKEIDPDIIHLHGVASIIYLRAVPQSIKIVMTIHGILGNDVHFERHYEYSKLERACCRSNRLDRIYFISSKLNDVFFKEYGPIIPSTETILNAYDNKAFFYQKKKRSIKPIKLITVATLSNIKGQKRVLQAISKANVDYSYECVGGDSDGLKEQLDEYAKENNIRYIYYGKRSPAEINDLLSDADFMILPSSTEGFGLVFLEAIACGVPVILPKELPIVKERGIIIPNVNAVLLNGYDVDSIARVLPNLRRMSFDRNEVSKTVLTISWHNVALKYIRSYTLLLKYE